MILSKFGNKFSQKTGILQLMEDLGQVALDGNIKNMMGGGNPANIPEMSDYFKKQYQNFTEDFSQTAVKYSSPQGDRAFIDALVDYLNTENGWQLTHKNIALTNGLQSAFFYLFNLFSGEYDDGSYKKVLFPLVPEYVGYADLHLEKPCFTANEPIIQPLTYQGESGFFKYRVDFEKLVVDVSTGAICCSRPTNPTGNVVTDDEIKKLHNLAKKHNIPLIVDNAYGQPFPDILFTSADLFWDEHVILCASLSKLGLPSLRTGIVIAKESVIEQVSSLNALTCLSPTRFAPALLTPMIKKKEVKQLTEVCVKPFYQKKVNFAISVLKLAMGDTPVKIHYPEGGIFLWVCFPDLPISSIELYQRLKSLGTIVIPGEHFFPGIDVNYFPHAKECIRVSYAQSDEVIIDGMQTIAKVVTSLYRVDKR